MIAVFHSPDTGPIARYERFHGVSFTEDDSIVTSRANPRSPPMKMNRRPRPHLSCPRHRIRTATIPPPHKINTPAFSPVRRPFPFVAPDEAVDSRLADRVGSGESGVGRVPHES